MFEVAIGLGVLVSLFFLETFGAAAGGIVVSGYLAMYLHQPITILATLSISFLVYLIVKILGTPSEFLTAYLEEIEDIQTISIREKDNRLSNSYKWMVLFQISAFLFPLL